MSRDWLPRKIENFGLNAIHWPGKRREPKIRKKRGFNFAGPKFNHRNLRLKFKLKSKIKF